MYLECKIIFGVLSNYSVFNITIAILVFSLLLLIFLASFLVSVLCFFSLPLKEIAIFFPLVFAKKFKSEKGQQLLNCKVGRAINKREAKENN